MSGVESLDMVVLPSSGDGVCRSGMRAVPGSALELGSALDVLRLELAAQALGPEAEDAEDSADEEDDAGDGEGLVHSDGHVGRHFGGEALPGGGRHVAGSSHEPRSEERRVGK